MNDSSGVFGQYCFSSEATCYYLLFNSIDCEANNHYSILVNSDTGAISSELYCLKIDKKARFAFTNFEPIDAIAKSSKKLAIAFPMQQGLFQVSRFSLEGAPNAIAAMRQAADALMKKDTSTKDRKL